MKVPHKLYLSLIGLLLLVFATFGYQSINNTSPSNTAQEVPVELKEVKSSDYKLLHIRNEYETTSFMEAKDLNNDGVDEIIYQPRSASWYNKTFILKAGDHENLFVPFCNNCQFETHASSPEFKDLNNDGLIDITLPKVIYLFDGKDYVKQ
ncbi:hypothetical protein A2697_02615 [Candidatus Curtissbacteria bacterium RIFCSPHIGHO2_01_FULL_41_44]|uniref:VCBS repeat-containing protein n=1 Tax=Candidatus Curtissbacteria bacterium RIFCSPLOWO2_01_FULL_42_50 TaxID=1797730 RepID=A0A1F5H2G5_9BACT|nr:MAG: hypothetical protein A2697_02615 [Candidatus Curtissbacteria bacterium RIFCSPHIGHO2_01_FULL_41_44]OGD92870.1 MAG: hypothetical protein A3C33_02130 [Candidatus Curtissbacteria bacterium RIFCSPHIGHO2_02_FULL_42_58]OGD96587.1 MAG: hypothetical protein A3E71_02780 [Candidatus Curtissbacteria bacterium RIFCSPHIGHO2_12_FULL_42_33]OGD98288.1 MAG: hypothetical protein A3B54_04220 [Candidatus Curtissbacteria bacterium RIFCSPLOWO2_01_FULL_42_50]OGE10360.1 MAG: hypothetical protein A3H87_02140 [Ca